MTVFEYAILQVANATPPTDKSYAAAIEHAGQVIYKVRREPEPKGPCLIGSAQIIRHEAPKRRYVKAHAPRPDHELESVALEWLQEHGYR